MRVWMCSRSAFVGRNHSPSARHMEKRLCICAPVSMTHKFDCDWGESRLLCCDLD